MLPTVPEKGVGSLAGGSREDGETGRKGELEYYG